MKRVNLIYVWTLLVVLGMAVFSSCSKDDESLITGKWHCYLAEGEEFYADGSKYPFSDEPDDDNIYEFKANGTLKFTGYGESSSGTWKYNGNKLTISSDGETQELSVVKLTATEMVLEFYTIDEDGDGFHSKGYFKKL